MTSPDGITWTTRNSAADLGWESVVYGNGRFVAVAAFGGSGNRVMTSDNTVLPLEWLKISGNRTAIGTTRLQWFVQEYQVKDYSIEKSTNGTHFTPLATLTSKGNGKNNYSFTGEQIVNGTYWFRIKQTDLDGRFTYRKVLQVKSTGVGHVKLYPNPTSDQIVLTVDRTKVGKQVVITSSNGKHMQQIKISSEVIRINISSFSAGSYSLRITGEAPVQFIKVN